MGLNPVAGASLRHRFVQHPGHLSLQRALAHLLQQEQRRLLWVPAESAGSETWLVQEDAHQCYPGDLETPPPWRGSPAATEQEGQNFHIV